MEQHTRSFFHLSLKYYYMHVLRMYSRYVKGSTLCSRSIRMFTMLRWIITHTYRYFFFLSSCFIGCCEFFCVGISISPPVKRRKEMGRILIQNLLAIKQTQRNGAQTVFHLRFHQQKNEEKERVMAGRVARSKANSLVTRSVSSYIHNIALYSRSRRVYIIQQVMRSRHVFKKFTVGIFNFRRTMYS